MKRLLLALALLSSSLAHADLENLGNWIFDSSGNAINLGQQTMTNSLPVAFASNQSALSCNQNTAAALSGAWPVKVTDGTNTMPTGDVLTRKIFVQATDGTTNQSYTSGGNANSNTAQVNGVAVSTSTGASGTGTQRVTLAADGQKTMANSTAVVLSSDQTGINTFQDKSSTGTISALNGAVTFTTNGMSTAAISAQGTFSATLQVQGQAGDSAWVAVLGYVPGSGNTATVLTGASMLVFPIGGFNQVRIIAIAYTSGTANIQYNLGSGTQGQQVFNLVPASLTGLMGGLGADGSAVVGNPVRVAGKDGSGNTQDFLTDTSGNLAILNKDGSGNAETSTTISGTAANKQPADVNSLSTGTARYYTSFATQQTAATAANATIFSMRNAAAATKTAIIENIYCREGFNAANPITRTQQTYVFQRFTTATPTTGTALTAGQGDSSDSASQVTDIRVLDTGLSVTSVVFSGNNLATMACDTTQGITCQQPQLLAPAGWKLAPGEGLAIRLGVAAVTGTSISCTIGWREQ